MSSQTRERFAAIFLGMCLGAVAAEPQAAQEPAPEFATRRAAAIQRMRESIAKQRESVRNQSARQPRVSSLEPAAPGGPECEPISPEQIEPMIAGSAAEWDVDPALVRALIHQESGFRPCAVSPRGALGLMQLMPETTALLGVADPFDPEQNVRSGVQYLRQMLDQFQNDASLALAAYNAGPSKVEDGSAAGLPETQHYVERILEEWNATKSSAPSATASPSGSQAEAPSNPDRSTPRTTRSPLVPREPPAWAR
jgi:soluble lytic murein transglycosylase-like protein